MGTFTSLHYHVVFSTKGRKPLITPDLAERLHEYLGGTVRGLNGTVDIIGGTADHVHILVQCGPTVSVSKLVQDLKSHSSGWVHRTFPEMQGFVWQEGFGAFTVSESACPKVREYIQTQAAHHRATDFQDEFRAFLKRHQITYDERYIWS